MLTKTLTTPNVAKKWVRLLSVNSDRNEKPDTPPDLAFGSRVKEVCAVVGGRKEMATLTGISKSAIDKYAQGQSDPSRSALMAMARAAGVSLQWLATGEDEIVGENAGHQRPASAEPPLDKWLFSRSIDGIRRVYRRVGGQIPTVSEVELGIEMHNRIVALAEGQEARHGALLMALDQLERDLQEARSSKHDETDQRTA